MAKIYTDEEIRYLRENPNVRVIRHDRLSLTYEFRCHLYDAYMANGIRGVHAALEQAGIPCKMVGPGVIRHLCGNLIRDVLSIAPELLPRPESIRIPLRKLICSFLPAPSYGKTMASPSPMTSYRMWTAIIRMLR